MTKPDLRLVEGGAAAAAPAPELPEQAEMPFAVVEGEPLTEMPRDLYIPPDVRRGLKSAEFDIPDDATAARYNKSYDKMVDFVGRMYRAGVPIVAGTDGTPGFTLQRELALYVQAGMTPAQALQVATLNGAKYSRTLNDRGTIAVGKRADLVLFDGDPTANIADVRKVALVIKNGEAYYPADIDRALGIAPFAEPVKPQPAAP